MAQTLRDKTADAGVGQGSSSTTLALNVLNPSLSLTNTAAEDDKAKSSKEAEVC